MFYQVAQAESAAASFVAGPGTAPLGEGSISQPVTWTRLLELYPDATIRFGFGVGVGSGWGPATMHVDNLQIGVDGQVTTYNFGN
ncbi:hypothetical protein [Halobaculum marinum]|uniref:Uncharacterized protein n=1 Tax=Halobaculum marinum TaxID=3031996 RepID=A0ABD5WWL5_9EURY|nr:hypothetical protein [Halobaculum sp. DT55]